MGTNYNYRYTPFQFFQITIYNDGSHKRNTHTGRMFTVWLHRVVGDDTFMSDQQSISVARRVTSTEPEIEAVLVEEKRIRTASSLKEARIVVDIKEPEKAREKLVDGGTSISKKHARTSLSEIEAILAKTQPCKLPLFTEPQQFYANQGVLVRLRRWLWILLGRWCQVFQI
ncbi:uncharacterized protein LOC113340155 isoform X2 [Papaver somniferum]|nr:uncharacterized protein LOC113340155 isoform X2 [Papaver somniferum]